MLAYKLKSFLRINYNNDSKNPWIYILLLILEVIFIFSILFSYSTFQSIFKGEYKQGIYRVELKTAISKEKFLDSISTVESYNNATIIINDNLIASFDNSCSIRYGSPISNNDDISVSKYDDYNIGDTINLFDKEYTVVGLNQTIYNEISIGSISADISIKEIIIYNNMLTSKKQKNQFISSIENSFEDAMIILPPEVTIGDIYTTSQHFTIIAFIIMLSGITMMLAYYYLLTKRKKSYVILSLIGITKGRLHLYSFLETTIVIFIKSLISIIIYLILEKNLLKNIQQSAFGNYYTISFWEYALIVLSYITVITIAYCLFLLFINHKSLKETMK